MFGFTKTTVIIKVTTKDNIGAAVAVAWEAVGTIPHLCDIEAVLGKGKVVAAIKKLQYHTSPRVVTNLQESSIWQG